MPEKLMLSAHAVEIKKKRRNIETLVIIIVFEIGAQLFKTQLRYVCPGLVEILMLLFIYCQRRIFHKMEV